MGEQPQPPRNPVLEALLGLLLSAGILPVELMAMMLAGAIISGSDIDDHVAALFWVFLAVGLFYFGFLFWMAIRKRRMMLPGLIIGAALWGLLSSACYQLVNL